jgi:hypothetical protein
VSWTTQDAGAPEVRFGTIPGAYALRQFGTYSSYAAADMCSQPANAWGYSSPGVINTAVLQQLAPNTTYYYIFGQEVGPARLAMQSIMISAMACVKLMAYNQYAVLTGTATSRTWNMHQQAPHQQQESYDVCSSMLHVCSSSRLMPPPGCFADASAARAGIGARRPASQHLPPQAPSPRFDSW